MLQYFAYLIQIKIKTHTIFYLNTILNKSLQKEKLTQGQEIFIKKRQF